MEQTYAYEDLLELVKELKNELKNISLQLATREQQKADEDVLTLLKKQEQEKNDAFNRIIHLEKQLDAKQKLERKIQQLKGKLQVMKHMGDEEDVAVKKKMEDMDEELKEKTEEMEELEAMNQTLLIKERKINDELQEARKELISGLNDLLSNRTMIGIKRMGELDAKSFQNACKERFPKDAEIKAAELCSKWEDELRNPSWHPFQIINVEGKIQGLSDLLSNRTQVGIKRMGELDAKAFHNACKERFSKDTEIKAT